MRGPAADAAGVLRDFQGLVEDRRATPRDDLASVIANAEVDGEPIGLLEAVGNYVVVATAGHDTTSSPIRYLTEWRMHIAEQPQPRRPAERLAQR